VIGLAGVLRWRLLLHKLDGGEGPNCSGSGSKGVAFLRDICGWYPAGVRVGGVLTDVDDGGLHGAALRRAFSHCYCAAGGTVHTTTALLNIDLLHLRVIPNMIAGLVILTGT
jgi:hypothetical protein